MLHQIAELTGIDLSDGRKIVNHSCRKTAIQMLKDNDIPEDEIMEFSGYRSREGVRTYKNSKEEKRIKNAASLIPLDFEDMEIEEFEYFPGNSWNDLNANDDSDDSGNYQIPLLLLIRINICNMLSNLSNYRIK